jgi:hypothetical protein
MAALLSDTDAATLAPDPDCGPVQQVDDRQRF